jgi:hypothetical protein
MKLYIVIYIAGLIGGVVGPLPYDEDECKTRIKAEWTKLNDVMTPQGFSKHDIRYACEWAENRPVLDASAGMPKPGTGR